MKDEQMKMRKKKEKRKRMHENKVKEMRRHLLGGEDELFAPVLVMRVCVLTAEILGHLSRRELSLADIAKVSGKVNCLS